MCTKRHLGGGKRSRDSALYPLKATCGFQSSIMQTQMTSRKTQRFTQVLTTQGPGVSCFSWNSSFVRRIPQTPQLVADLSPYSEQQEASFPLEETFVEETAIRLDSVEKNGRNSRFQGASLKDNIPLS